MGTQLTGNSLGGDAAQSCVLMMDGYMVGNFALRRLGIKPGTETTVVVLSVRRSSLPNGRTKMDEDYDPGYDEGSDVDNWEAEQCFQDQVFEGEAEFFEGLTDDEGWYEERE